LWSTSISSDLFHILSIHNIRLCEEKFSYLYNHLQLFHHMTARSTYKVFNVVLKQSDPMITVLFNPKYILNETKLLQNMQVQKDNSLSCCHLSFIGSMTIKIFGLLLIILSLIFWRKKFIQENFYKLSTNS